MHSLRRSDFGTSLFLAAGAVAITAAVVFASGQLVLPDQAPNPAQGDIVTVPTIEDLTGSQAILVLSGDHHGRYELNQLTVGEWNDGTSAGQPLKLSLAFRGDGFSLVISARDITADTPATGDAASAIISLAGASYYGNNGECSITLDDVDYEVLEPQRAVLDGVPRGVPIPAYAGTVECDGVEEIRTDRRIDLYAVFRHQPEN